MHEFSTHSERTCYLSQYLRVLLSCGTSAKKIICIVPIADPAVDCLEVLAYTYRKAQTLTLLGDNDLEPCRRTLHRLQSSSYILSSCSNIVTGLMTRLGRMKPAVAVIKMAMALPRQDKLKCGFGSHSLYVCLSSHSHRDARS